MTAEDRMRGALKTIVVAIILVAALAIAAFILGSR
jgi:hypothetical protein